MSESREMVLAKFQSVTGIENVEEAIMWLENANWDLIEAINSAMPQETTASHSSEMPSTSGQRIVEVYVNYMDETYTFHVPDSINVGSIKKIIYSLTGIEKSKQVLTGWPSTPGLYIISDKTVLKMLNISDILYLHLDTPETPDQSSNVT